MERACGSGCKKSMQKGPSRRLGRSTADRSSVDCFTITRVEVRKPILPSDGLPFDVEVTRTYSWFLPGFSASDTSSAKGGIQIKAIGAH